VAALGLVVHQERDEAARTAQRVTAWLGERGHEVRLLAEDAAIVDLEAHAVAVDAFAAGLDLAVSLGGDGTILRTVDLVATEGVPVLGVHIGQLGYLTEVEPDVLESMLERFLAGEHDVEERMLLQVAVEATGEVPGGSARPLALNEAVLEKTPSGHTVRLAVWVNGRFFTTYATDGLIVATPTGSTAYAFSARGPIVAPTHRSLQLTPVSPHMLFDRTLVLNPDDEIRLVVRGHRPATLSVDGRNLGELVAGDAIVCTGSSHSARLVTFGERDFHAILKTKFGLEDR
jgi:NAD+ kinase